MSGFLDRDIHSPHTKEHDMKILGINSSPRKHANTAQVVEKALEGARSVGAETNLIHLYPLNYKGCAACYACKRGERKPTICALKDELRPVLEEAMQADVLIMGVPIYYSSFNSTFLSFVERLLFMNFTYDPAAPTKFNGSIHTALLCTMNVDDQQLEQYGYAKMVQNYLHYLGMVLRGSAEWLPITDTKQFDDYSKYNIGNMFDPVHKAKVHEEKFPKDLEKVFQLGARLGAGKKG